MPNHRQPSLLALALFALLASVPGAKAQAVDYVGRIGLYGSPEYARSTDGLEYSSYYYYQGSHAVGISKRYNGASEAANALWMADLATATTSRIGLYSGAEFTNSSDTSQITSLYGWREDGFAYGISSRFNGAQDAGSAAWVALTADRITKRVGLYTGAEFTSATGRQVSTLLYNVAGGYAAGASVRYNGTASELGQAAWVADAHSGATTRIGLYSGAEFTRSTDGTQLSSVTAISEGGHVIGDSYRYDGAASTGRATWVADAATGATTRLGLYLGAEFTSSADGSQTSHATTINSRGDVVGYSSRYQGSTAAGEAAWVANAATGSTARIGLYNEPGFTSSSGVQISEVTRLTESGHVFGTSVPYAAGSAAGQAVWVADAATGATTRIGLYGSPDYVDPDSGYQRSNFAGTTASGYAAGESNTFDSLDHVGWGAWVADASTGITTRIGLYTGSEFTNTFGGLPLSAVAALTESGYVIGYSIRTSGQAAWVASAATGATTRVGLYGGAEFTSTSYGTQSSTASKVTESGYVIGTSTRYNGSEEAGQATWLANAATGTTTRIGLYDDPQFTYAPTNIQSSTVTNVMESGYAVGYSLRYGEYSMGSAQWVAQASTGITTRVGIFDVRHTREDGYQYGVISTLTEEGYIGGYSTQYNGMAEAGRTAWLFDLGSATQITLELSVNSVTQESFSNISGITADGLVYGNYVQYDAGTSVGLRAFIWRKDLGAILLNEALSLAIAENGWDYLTSAVYSDGEYILGLGQVTGLPTASSALYVASVPEPASISLLAAVLGGAAVFFMRRRYA